MPSTDPTADILASIFVLLNEMHSEASSIEVSSQRLVDAEHDLSQELTQRGKSRWNLWKATQDFNVAASSFTQDVELLVNEQRLTALLGGLALDEITITNPIPAQLRPVGSPKMTWSRTVGTREAMPDNALLVTNWTLAIGSQPPNPLVATLSVIFVAGGTADLRIAVAGAPEFTRQDGTTFDPLSVVPIDQRTAIYAQIRSVIGQKLAGFSQALPAISAGPIGVQPAPFTYSRRRFLNLIDQKKGKRRVSVPLVTAIPSSYNSALCLGKLHVEPFIRQQIAAQDVDVRDVRFTNGGVDVDVYRKEERTECVVHVKVEVFLTYRLILLNRSATYLYIYAFLSGGQYSYEIDNCWPICGRIEREVRQRTEDEINNKRTIEANLGSVSGLARAAGGVFTSHGVSIYLLT